MATNNRWIPGRPPVALDPLSEQIYLQRLQRALITETRVKQTVQKASFQPELERVYPCDATSGNITVTLPQTIASVDKIYVIKKIDSSAHTVIITPRGSDTIDGTATLTLTKQWDVAIIRSDGISQWYIEGSRVGGVVAASPLTTKGDIYTFDTGNQRLPVGTDGQSLVADSTQTTGLNWKALGSVSTLFDHFANASTSGSGSPITLYSDTIPAGQLGTNGDKLYAFYEGTTSTTNTSTRDWKVNFGGTTIFDSGAVGSSNSQHWKAVVEIIRDSSTSVRCSVWFILAKPAAPFGVTFENIQYATVTGLTLTNGQALAITGTPGAASNDITATMGAVYYHAYQGGVLATASSQTGNVLLETKTASNAADNLAFTATISSTYDVYVFELVEIVLATAGSYLAVEYSTDGGGTWLSTAYKFILFHVNSNAASSIATDGSLVDTAHIRISGVLKNTTQALQGQIRLMNPLQATLGHNLYGKTTWLNNSDGFYYMTDISGENTGTTAVNAIRFRSSSGNITSGKIYSYGVRKT